MEIEKRRIMNISCVRKNEKRERQRQLSGHKHIFPVACGGLKKESVSAGTGRGVSVPTCAGHTPLNINITGCEHQEKPE